MTLGNAIAILRRNGVGVRAGEMDCTVEIFDAGTGDSYGRLTCAELEEMAEAAVLVERAERWVRDAARLAALRPLVASRLKEIAVHILGWSDDEL